MSLGKPPGIEIRQFAISFGNEVVVDGGRICLGRHWGSREKRDRKMIEGNQWEKRARWDEAIMVGYYIGASIPCEKGGSERRRKKKESGEIKAERKK